MTPLGTTAAAGSHEAPCTPTQEDSSTSKTNNNSREGGAGGRKRLRGSNKLRFSWGALDGKDNGGDSDIMIPNNLPLAVATTATTTPTVAGLEKDLARVDKKEEEEKVDSPMDSTHLRIHLEGLDAAFGDTFACLPVARAQRARWPQIRQKLTARRRRAERARFRGTMEQQQPPTQQQQQQQQQPKAEEAARVAVKERDFRARLMAAVRLIMREEGTKLAMCTSVAAPPP